MKNKSFFFVIVLIYFLVVFSQFHLIIPGLKYLKLGFISAKIGIILGLLNLKNINFKHPIVKYYGMFSIVVLLSVFTSYSKSHSINTFMNLFELFCLYFVGLIVSASKYERIKTLAKAIILTGLGVAIYTITHSGHGPGVLIDENDVGVVLLILLPFTFFLNNTFKSIWWRIISFAGFGLILAAIAATLSRGAMVGTLPTLFLIWLRSKQKILSLVALGVVSVVVIMNAPPKLINEFDSISDTNGGTAGERRYYWELSIEMFKKKPIMGVGPQCWGNAIWSNLIATPKSVHNATPHSIYFQLLSEMGAIGTILYLSLLFAVFSTGSKITRLLKSNFFNAEFETQTDQVGFKSFFTNFNTALLVGIIGGLIAGAFLSLLFFTHLYACFAMVYLVHTILTNELSNPLLENNQQLLENSNQNL